MLWVVLGLFCLVLLLALPGIIAALRGEGSFDDWPEGTPEATRERFPDVGAAITSYCQEGLALLETSRLTPEGLLAGDPADLKEQVDGWAETLEFLTMTPEQIVRVRLYSQPMAVAFRGHVEVMSHLIQADPKVRSVFRTFAERLACCSDTQLKTSGEEALPFLEESIPAGDPRLEKLELLDEGARLILSGQK